MNPFAKILSFGGLSLRLFAAAGVLGMLVLASSCQDSPPEEAVYDPTPYAFEAPSFPPPMLPSDNALTEAGVLLGRMLFHDPRLSADDSQACADCHRQTNGLSDPRRFSIGIRGEEGTRQAMALHNMAWHEEGFFWDNRAATLREQSLMPIEDPLEMDADLEAIVAKLNGIQGYRDQSVRAFGEAELSAERMGLAMEQFMLTMVSDNSKYDRVLRGEESFTAAEQRGLDLYNAEFDPTGAVKGAECFHCHGGFNFTNNRAVNNGLDPVGSIADIGLEGVTGDPADRAKFKVPSLRNIAVTAPYMHDGRFNTLEEVIAHYNNGVQSTPSTDPLLQFSISPGLGLDAEDVADLIAFLQTLTDDAFLNEAAFAAPALPQ